MRTRRSGGTTQATWKRLEGRPFGFQLTFFRRALTPEEADDQASESDWRTNQIYLAHFTISDIEGNAFYPTERFSRGAAGLAGAQGYPLPRLARKLVCGSD